MYLAESTFADEPPVPNNITIAFSDVMNISWNVLGHESCRFTFHVAIRTANDQTERRNVTQKTFALFFNLQPNDYIISVTVHAGSCASNPVNMVFTVSGSLTKGELTYLWKCLSCTTVISFRIR